MEALFQSVVEKDFLYCWKYFHVGAYHSARKIALFNKSFSFFPTKYYAHAKFYVYI